MYIKYLYNKLIQGSKFHLSVSPGQVEYIIPQAVVAALNEINTPPTNTFSVSRALQIWFISSKVTAYKHWAFGITCHMYSREEGTRLTGEINDMSAFIPGAERYFQRSLHVKNGRDRLIISSGSQEKGGAVV